MNKVILGLGMGPMLWLIGQLATVPVLPIVNAQDPPTYQTPTPVLAPAGPISDNPVPCVNSLPPGTYPNVVVPAGETCHLRNQSITGFVHGEAGSGIYFDGVQIGGNLSSHGVVGLTNVQVLGQVDLRPACGVGTGVACGLSPSTACGIRPSFIRAAYLGQGLLVQGGCGHFELSNSTVSGHLQLGGAEPASDSGPDQISSSHIGGVVQAHERFGLTLDQASTGGHVSVWQQQGAGEIHRNSVSGNLDFAQNRGGMHAITNNSVSGSLQCHQNEPPPVLAGNSVGEPVSCP